MTNSVASEIRRYRSLTVALIAGITVSVAMFVAFLNVDLEERERELSVQSQLAALRTETLLTSAFTALATEIDFLSVFRGSGGDITATLASSIQDLGMRDIFEQFCLLDADGEQPGFRMNANRDCPQPAQQDVIVSAPLSLNQRQTGRLLLVSGSTAAVPADVVLIVPIDEAFNAVFELSAQRMLSRTIELSDEELADALQACLYFEHAGLSYPVACNELPERGIATADDFAASAPTSFTAGFSIYGQRWQVVSILRPSAVATSISLFPVAALLFFLIATAAVCWYIYTSTDSNMRLARQQRGLQRALLELRKRNEDLEQFAYMASHDLQTPIRHIISRATMLREDLEDGDTEAVQRNIGIIATAGERMHDFVIDLLEFCRASETDVDMRLVKLDSVVSRELADLLRESPVPGLKADIRMLPTVHSDEAKIASVLRNLLSNAIKFRKHEGTPQLEVGAQRKDNDRAWTVYVRDAGIGIDNTQLERIFLPFKRLEDAASAEGTGVGLSIAKKLVERLGGRIWAESEPGEGTTFYFTIPDHFIPVDALSADQYVLPQG